MALTISKPPVSMINHVTWLSLDPKSHCFVNYNPNARKGRVSCMRKQTEFVVNQRSEYDGIVGESDQEFVKVLREMKPYLSVHSERAFVVVLSSEIVATPYLDDILKVPTNQHSSVSAFTCSVSL